MPKTNKPYLFTLAFIAALGGFLFGYDTAVISGTISMVQSKYALSPMLEGWYVSSALVGCIAGVAMAGWLSDKYGRKTTLMLSAILFSISAFGCMVAIDFQWLVTYRLVGGMGVGVASMVSPLYISEISPAHIRGSLVTLYQFAITLGILCSYFVNAWLLKISTTTPSLEENDLIHTVFYTEVWRGMLGTEALPAILFLLLLLIVPRSPRWLIVKGQLEKALSILTRIGNAEMAQKEVEEIRDMVSREKGAANWTSQPGIRTALMIGIFLSLLAQFSGINAIIYYGPRILEEAGLSLGDALGGQVIIGMVNVLFTLVAIWKIDQLGRRPLLLIGSTGIIGALIIIGMLFHFNITSGTALMSFILFFIACFAFSFGPVVWVVISEIYPTRIRGRAMSIATLATWLGTALVGQIVPVLLDTAGPSGTFWLFALFCSPAIYLAWKVLPETKGKSLEHIERYWIEIQQRNS